MCARPVFIVPVTSPRELLKFLPERELDPVTTKLVVWIHPMTIISEEELMVVYAMDVPEVRFSSTCCILSISTVASGLNRAVRDTTLSTTTN